MTDNWEPKETTTHQDHVIAHVIGAAVCGYFVYEEALYILLDIGFVWTIFVDGQMGLLPHPVAVSELEVDEETRQQIKAEIDVLLGSGAAAEKLRRFIRPPVECQIKEVTFLAADNRRRLLVTGEQGTLIIETSLATGEVLVTEC